jgi:hypothetical protein
VRNNDKARYIFQALIHEPMRKPTIKIVMNLLPPINTKKANETAYFDEKLFSGQKTGEILF